MKQLFYSYLLLNLLLVCACSKVGDECEPIVPKPTEERILLEDGSEIVTYPNGLTVKILPEGEIIWQGDIYLTQEQLDILTEGMQTRGSITSITKRTWPGGVIFYKWGPNIKIRAKESYLQAMDQWMQKTPIRFREVFPEESVRDVLILESGTGNGSYIGRTGGRQLVTLAHLHTVGDAIHELGHAIGLAHEHTRQDRDKYIRVHEDNIKAEYKIHYQIDPPEFFSTDTFDFNSIMMYGSYATGWAIDSSKPVMTKIDGTTWDQVEELSPLDIQAVNIRYGTLTVKVKAETSLSGNVIGGGTYTGGQLCMIQAEPNMGREFAGWYQDGKLISTNVRMRFPVYQNWDLTAKFRPTIDFAFFEPHIWPILEGNVAGTVDKTAMGLLFGATITIKATPNKGWRFVGWRDGDNPNTNAFLSTKNPYEFTINKDLILVAHFDRQ